MGRQTDSVLAQWEKSGNGLALKKSTRPGPLPYVVHWWPVPWTSFTLPFLPIVLCNSFCNSRVNAPIVILFNFFYVSLQPQTLISEIHTTFYQFSLYR